jgi:predicted transcriptional regulator
MIIRIMAPSGTLEIADPENFRAFSVRIEGTMDPAVQAEFLGRVAVSSDREHAWISETALREWPSLKAEGWWQDSLSNMIAAVQKFGWIDQANRSIRAHIEYAP